MKNFTLLFTPVIKSDISAMIDELKKEHDWASCDNQEICPINKTSIQMGTFMATQANEFSQLKTIIDDLYADKDIDFILLIDDAKDIAYIYKGTGTLSELKKTKLPLAVKMYEHGIKQESVFVTLEDVRSTMSTNDNSKNGLHKLSRKHILAFEGVFFRFKKKTSSIYAIGHLRT